MSFHELPPEKQDILKRIAKLLSQGVEVGPISLHLDMAEGDLQRIIETETFQEARNAVFLEEVEQCHETDSNWGRAALSASRIVETHLRTTNDIDLALKVALTADKIQSNRKSPQGKPLQGDFNVRGTISLRAEVVAMMTHEFESKDSDLQKRLVKKDVNSMSAQRVEQLFNPKLIQNNEAQSSQSPKDSEEINIDTINIPLIC